MTEREKKATAKANQLARMQDALKYIKKHKLPTDRNSMKSVANRFLVHPKTLEKAIQLIARGEV
jgi:hypothetical protein